MLSVIQLLRSISLCFLLITTSASAKTINKDGKKQNLQQQQGKGGYLRTYPDKKTKGDNNDNVGNNNNNNNVIKRRVWVHFKEGQRDAGVRTIQKFATIDDTSKNVNENKDSNSSNRLKINFDFPKVNSMVVTATDDEIQRILSNDPNVAKITDDPIRQSHRLKIIQKRKNRNKNYQQQQQQSNSSNSTQIRSYAIDLLQVQDVWDQGIIGNNINVCVIDSGIDTNHEDLQQKNLTGDSLSSLRSWDYDDDGHGTHISGIIAANNNNIGIVGLAYGVNIHTVKVFDEYGFVYSSAVVDAAYKCRDAGAKIITLSLGGATTIDEERDVFTELYEQDGILSIASSGNYGDSTYSYPASYANVVSVGAIDQNKYRGFFSQYNDMVDLVAPGVDILSTIPISYDCTICDEQSTGNSGYASLDGTSQASPHVAALAALLWSYQPSAPVEHIYNALLASAEDLGSVGRDDYYGYGLARAGVALNILNATLNGAPLQIGATTGVNVPSSSIIDNDNVISCPFDEILVSVNIKTDFYGNETSWEVVRDVDGFTVMAGAGLGKHKMYQTNRCLPNNCYTFSIYDSFGDGIDSEFGAGYYNVSVNGTEIATGGKFNYSETVSLSTDCLDIPTDPKPALPQCYEVSLKLKTDAYPSETSVILENIAGGAVENFWSNETFVEQETEYTLSACIALDSCYRFEIIDTSEDGICCFFGNGYFELSYDGSVIHSGGDFNSSDSYLVGESCAEQF